MEAPTILIVDDEANQRLLFGQALRTLEIKCRIVHAASGTEALAYIDDEAVSLLITDYQMPAMNGIDLVAELRARNDMTPVIMISAYNLEEVRGAALALDIEYFLVKPFPIECLRRLATTMLSQA